jgi:CBS domain
VFGFLPRVSLQEAESRSSRNQAQYEHFNPPVKPVGEEPTPLPTKDSAVTVDKKPEKVALSDDLDKPKPVIDVMVKKVFYCFEDQSVDEARRIMREHDLPYLLVLDRNMRIVGMVRMRNLMLDDEDRPQSGG